MFKKKIIEMKFIEANTHQKNTTVNNKYFHKQNLFGGNDVVLDKIKTSLLFQLGISEKFTKKIE